MFKAGDKFKVIGNSKNNKYGKHWFEIDDTVEFVKYKEKVNGKRSKKYVVVSKISSTFEQTVKLQDLQYQFKMGDKVRIKVLDIDGKTEIKGKTFYEQVTGEVLTRKGFVKGIFELDNILLKNGYFYKASTLELMR